MSFIHGSPPNFQTLPTGKPGRWTSRGILQPYASNVLNDARLPFDKINRPPQLRWAIGPFPAGSQPDALRPTAGGRLSLALLILAKRMVSIFASDGRYYSISSLWKWIERQRFSMIKL
jgi:hypothetical protein